MIEAIITAEVERCSQERGEIVSANDPVVQNRVCEIVLRIGAKLRKQAMAA